MIRGARCQCGKNIVPFRRLCPSCGNQMEEADYEDSGVVLTHTILHTAPEGFEAPIRLAMVRLGGGANVLCTMEEEKALSIDDEVLVNVDGERYICRIHTRGSG